MLKKGCSMTDRIAQPSSPRRFTRRNLLTSGAGIAGMLLLQACGGQEPIAQPTQGASPTNTTAAASASTSTAASSGGTGSGTSATASSGGTRATSTTSTAGAASAAPAAAPSATPAIAHKKGGIIKVAMIGEPPSVADAMFTTTTVTSDITRHLYEGLFARSATYSPKPMLVDKYTLSDDGLHYEFTLRKGVKFHNGKDLVAADVVASLKRWGMLTGRGKSVVARMVENGIKAKDALTVTMDFKEPAGVLLNFLAEIEAFIMPEDIATSAGKDKLSDNKLIGTGPYMFKEHQVDRIIRLVRYDGYQAREEATDGLTGKKVAYADEIQIFPVPDVTVATNGVITGQYHFATTVDNDQFDTLKNDPNCVPVIVKPSGWLLINYNKRKGLFADKRIRQAVGLSFDRQEALIAAYGRKELTQLDPGLAAPETVWGSQVSRDIYLRKDPETAKALLKEAGYNGQVVRWLTTKEYPYHYNTAAYIKQEMEAIGMKVELVVSDWATVVQRRANPDLYEMIIVGLSSTAHPATQVFNDKEWPGWWDSADKDQIVARMLQESDPAKSKAAIEDYQRLIYSDFPFTKIGDSYALQALRKEVQGFTTTNGWTFFNVSLA